MVLGTMLTPFLVTFVVTEPVLVMLAVCGAVFTAAGFTGSVVEVMRAVVVLLLPRMPVRYSADGTTRTTARPAQARPQVNFELSLICCIRSSRPRPRAAWRRKTWPYCETRPSLHAVKSGLNPT